MTCTFSFSDTSYTLFRVIWYKGSNRHLVYYYKRYTNKGSAFNDLTDRCEGNMEENVHKLYINSTIVTDEDTYTCQIETNMDTKKLTVNGEYSAKYFICKINF